MESTELRIGNLIAERNGHIVTVSSIGYNIICIVDSQGTTQGYFKTIIFNPIPLTKDWLIKFNFKYSRKKPGTQGVYSNGKVNVMLSNSGNVYTMKNKLIPYVHTFQNWYYYDRLTNEELIIKEQI